MERKFNIGDTVKIDTNKEPNFKQFELDSIYGTIIDKIDGPENSAIYKISSLNKDIPNMWLTDTILIPIESKKTQVLRAYIDGSFDDKTDRYSCGIVFVLPDNSTEQYHHYEDYIGKATMRNVAGELLGATNAIMYAINNNYDELHLYYDYIGIEEWAMKRWKANNEHTQNYVKFYDDAIQKIKIYFHKVTAHSGDKYNELADKLAKQALKMAEVHDTPVQNNKSNASTYKKIIDKIITRIVEDISMEDVDIEIKDNKIIIEFKEK